jgi:protein-tyrosine phosphatase
VFQPRFGRAFTAVAQADGTALVHCAGGKDRTGLVCALALRLAGVPAEAVADDWAISGESWAPSSHAWIEAAEDEAEANRRRMFSAAPREAVVDVLAELDRGGGADAYLAEAGVPAAARERIALRLRGAAQA